MADDVKNAWEDAAKRFGSLGQVLKDRYKQAGPPAAADAAASDEAAAQAKAVKDALNRLSAAIDDVAARANAAVNDDEVKAHTKDALHALEHAIGATFNQVGEAIDSRFRKKPPTAE